MAQSKKINQIASNGMLEYIQDTLSKIDIKRIEAAISSIRKEKDIARLNNIFSTVNNCIAEESDALSEQAENYNDRYATDCNGKFTTAYQTLSCIKTQVFALYSLFSVMSEKPKQRPGHPQVNGRSLKYKIDHAAIGRLPYSLPIFVNKSGTQTRLIKEVKTFLDYLNENLNACLGIIEEEERIGNDLEEVSFRYDKQVEEIYNLIKYDKKKSRSTDADYYQELLSASNNPEMIKKWWHKLTIAQMADVAWGVKNKALEGYTPLERKTFDEDLGLLQKFRTVVQHIDEMGKLTAQKLVYAYKYIGSTISQNSFVKCFFIIYKQLGGKQKELTYAGFNQACTAHLHELTPEYINFQQTMDMY